ncbi:tetratricopeptide repeat protein [Prosthecobacter sp.]|uniref:tetratricopeptide repeat protein n=1 Tax=Prosthecobacter sp. TaxID=1965333 RepID=UPI002ABAC0D5|nr:tetratricopeptide repeat protein [Prosthecobacter sp.]MDZ4404350.1 tetratricopeptide repeat protein [Prosthecobacter sp.]
MTEAERRIIAAQGYVELGLYEEAREELSPLPAEMNDRVDVLEITLLCLMGGHRWSEALALANRLCQQEPAEPGGFIHAAFCLHELGRTAEAVDVLSRGPATLRTKPVYYYNMGCYHARLGHYDKSMTYLERAFEMDGELRQHAKKDRDLDCLRAQLESHPA